MAPKHVEDVIERFQKRRTQRSFWESQWQDVKDLMRPNTTDFSRVGVQGERKFEHIYESTAVDSLDDFAGGLSGYLTSPTDRWFGLRMADPTFDPGLRGRLWLDRVSDMIYHGYSSPISNFNPSMHEGYLDIGAFGITIIYQYWYRPKNTVRFKAFPLADCFIEENHESMVDTIYRTVRMTARQIEQRFGKVPYKIAQENKADKVYNIVHAVFPREDRNPRKRNARNKRFVSIWVCVDTKEECGEGGYDVFPYLVPRWQKLAGEVYGRGPGMKALPDTRVLNRLEQYMLKAGAKSIDPPLQVPNDGFLLPIRTHPGALNYVEPGADEIKPLIDPRFFNLPFGLDQMDQKRDNIRRTFYNHLFTRQKKREEQTATEIEDERQEMLRQLSPNLGRLETELLGPMIAQSYYYYDLAGMIPLMPPEIEGQPLAIEYTSPAAKAQTGVRAIAMSRYLERIAPLIQLEPQTADNINTDAYAQELAVAMGTPASIINPPEVVQQRRQQRAQDEQAAAMAGAAEPVSKAIKNIADAQSKA